jgi:hypothetical protein
MKELIVALLAWIIAETGLVMPPPPSVQKIAQAEMNRLSHVDGSTDDNVRALYYRPTQTVYLRTDWNHAELQSQAALLHELVHHVQARNRVAAPCPAALEKQAYALTIKWLQQQGVADPYAVLGTDPLTIAFRSACPQTE